jgi:hypothetical protein
MNAKVKTFVSMGSGYEWETHTDGQQILCCPKCDTELRHFSGIEQIPEYFWCPKCEDYAYAEDGSLIAPLE